MPKVKTLRMRYNFNMTYYWLRPKVCLGPDYYRWVGS